MSIASEITRISDNVADAYTAANAKGATMPMTQNSDNLATTIATIPTGTTPTGSISITSNGTYDVTDKATAVVNVPTTAPAYYIEKTVDANGKLKNAPNIFNFNNITDIGNYCLYGQYSSTIFPNNTSIDMSSVTKISGLTACSYMFYTSSGITSIDMSSITEITGAQACDSMLYGCFSLTSFDLSSLTTISGRVSTCASMFQSCTGLTSANLPSLTTINVDQGCQFMFSNCRNITSANLSSLTTITGSHACSMMFGNTGITSINLSSLTTVNSNNALAGMFSGCAELVSANLNGLNSTAVLAPSYSQLFIGCVKLESVTLGGLTASTFASATNQIQYLFNNTTGSQAPNGCTVHFPSNFDPSDPNHTFDASTLTGYPTFGGNASYVHVAFDLPATE